MTARDAILGKVRRALHVSAEDPMRNAAVDHRISQHPVGVIPERGRVSPDAQLVLFTRMAEKVGATVARVSDVAGIPEAIAAYLRGRNLPARLRMGDDVRLNTLPWPRTQIETVHGASDGNDLVGLSHAFAAVAETGTLVLLSGPDNPTTLNFLPETHVVVLQRADLAGDYETIWRKLRSEYGRAMPRTVNLISGPSRSADIEQTIVRGAHGPRELHIVVVG
jgi:L-lactate dehydrogenase complex protein LldG